MIALETSQKYYTTSELKDMGYSYYKIGKMEENGQFDVLPKKEVAKLNNEREKLEANLGGIHQRCCICAGWCDLPDECCPIL